MVIPNEYDDVQRRCVPNFEAFFGTVAGYIRPYDTKILELASGTGFLTEMIVKKCPGSDITCVDIDKDMLDFAAGKPSLSDVNFIHCDMKDYRSGEFDVVILTQAVFALSDDERKSFLADIYGMLKKGGRFVCGDMFSPESDFEKKVYKEKWAEVMLKNGFSDEETCGMLNPLDGYCRDNTVLSFVSELKDVGFSEVISPYRCGYYSVVVSYR
ncbi:ubiquinone/menaquinone biosynthesis C-methylase UbiE [Methanomicrobium sp. W14]|uniref:class I SAM-dependent methyltransferase n=1 Tax=Methanomicrobium sp. W14 TaxID=2817839 RepID=UPI001AE717DD|nr:class I SAM-dependent methyltransferase [Methanomicrobium sp. W14]MBP2133692.1 ubiquinone/menaquinone biosynthesis C-methylase UbiE [Methanomicrobium sp. W14]